MNRIILARLGLRARLALSRLGPVGAGAALLLAAALAALGWLAQATDLLERELSLATRMDVLRKSEPALAPPAANENLTLFYRSLGRRGHAEAQLRILFVLAEKAGLALSKGEYRKAFDSDAQVATYQVTLPVKGSYRAIRRFAMQALRAIPFASLDDISFRRDAVGDANVEARLRFTLYLADPPAGERR